MITFLIVIDIVLIFWVLFLDRARAQEHREKEEYKKLYLRQKKQLKMLVDDDLEKLEDFDSLKKLQKEEHSKLETQKSSAQELAARLEETWKNLNEVTYSLQDLLKDVEEAKDDLQKVKVKLRGDDFCAIPDQTDRK